MTKRFFNPPNFHAPNPSDSSLVEVLGRSGHSHEKEREGYNNGSSEPFHNEIFAKLPDDPFEMKLAPNWMVCLIEDPKKKFSGAHGREKKGPCKAKNDIVDQLPDDPFEMGLIIVLDRVGDLPDSGRAGDALAANAEESCSVGDGEPPHDALQYALGYLSIQDLLSVERVCKTLCSKVQDDPLLWRSIRLDAPLSNRLTDDALLQLTQRAQGMLKCLSLVDCPKITNHGLKRVLESNPRITELSVPGCARLTGEGLMNSLKILKSADKPCVKRLRIGGLRVTQDQYEELKSLLGLDRSPLQKTHKPQFFRGYSSYLCDPEIAIDIEVCPRCQNPGLVYDCPIESCQEKKSEQCRGCKACIPRCLQCGRCTNNCEYEETFGLEQICLGCCKHLFLGRWTR